MIFSTVVVGGLTRLTQSGLSMVQWKPIHGIVPPLNEQEWGEEFSLYQQSPEYKKKNQGMSLDEFKYIFYWEYIHRVLGRLIGLVFFLPLVFFQLKGWLKNISLKVYGLPSRLSWKLWIGFMLGGSQGLLGWYMVKSGLIDNPHVSHYRLAAHLGLAFFIEAYLLWILFDLMSEVKNTTMKMKRSIQVLAQALLLVVGIQILYGAFTAGLHAGHNYNTFPKMKGDWIPEGLLAQIPIWTNFFESHLTVQFIHRSIAWLLMVLVFTLFFYSKKCSLSEKSKRAIWVVSGLFGVQFTLGILTLIHYVPVPLASLHQIGAFFLFTSVLYLNHSLVKNNG
ncbi:MAG: COX15/CtaA family protein [Bdellovibrionales bacterium]|nr:COX15/CtaA family protein [Bdellovibrionales bacterium]